MSGEITGKMRTQEKRQEIQRKKKKERALTLSGPRFFRYRKDRGGGGFSVLRVLGMKKASKFDLFQKCQTKIFIFEYFTKINP